jgi:polysaccharide pyruvyl transferase CsaB
MSKVVISGYYGFSNSGDEAILMALTRSLKRIEPQIDITVLSANPADTEASYGVSAVNRNNIINCIKAIRQCDCFISGGGSLIQDVTSKKSLVYYLSLIAIARWFGKKVVVYANGIGPLNWAFGRALTRRVLLGVDVLSVRDQDSMTLLQKIGITAKPIILAADPVFSLSKSDSEPAEKMLESRGIDPGKPIVCFNVRPWRWSEKINKVLAEVADFIAREMKAQVLLIALNPEDVQVTHELSELIQSGTAVITGRYRPEEVMSVISHVDLLVGIRLHSLIFAAQAGVPFLGISYDPKVKSLLKMFDMPVIEDIKALELNDLLIQLSHLWHDREILSQNISKRTEELAKKVQVLNQNVADILKPLCKQDARGVKH